MQLTKISNVKGNNIFNSKESGYECPKHGNLNYLEVVNSPGNITLCLKCYTHKLKELNIAYYEEEDTT